MGLLNLSVYLVTTFLFVVFSESFLINPGGGSNQAGYVGGFHSHYAKLFSYHRTHQKGGNCKPQCDPNAVCRYAGHNAWVCKCKKHYTGNGTSCTEYNPCDTKVCVEHAFCHRVREHAICMCHGGRFLRDGSCPKIDECNEQQRRSCDPNATCTVHRRRIKCRCPHGYTGTGRSCSKKSNAPRHSHWFHRSSNGLIASHGRYHQG